LCSNVSEQLCQWMKVSPPTNIMLAQPWNTVAERNILMDLMELLLQVMEEAMLALWTII
jgi:hypothetical protein